MAEGRGRGVLVWKGRRDVGLPQGAARGVCGIIENQRPPPPQTEVTIVGNSEIYDWENLIGLLLVHTLLGPKPPPPRSKDALAFVCRGPGAGGWGAATSQGPACLHFSGAV